MASGDERYLTRRDRGPQRRFARDYVDSRTSFGELMLPLLLVVLALGLVENYTLQAVAYVVMMGYLIATIFDSFWIGMQVKRGIEERWGVGSMEKGIRWYAAMRAVQFRRIRLPKPQVSRSLFRKKTPKS